MRNLCLSLSGFALMLSISGAAFGQMQEVKIRKEIRCDGMTGQSMMGYAMPHPGMMRCDMMEPGMLQPNLCCPMMMGFLRDAGDYLSYKDLIELSDDQVSSLKSISDAYRRELIRMKADLQLAMLDLENLLSESEVDFSKAENLTDEIAGIQAQMMFKRIEASVKAKRVLTKEQLKKLEDLYMGESGAESGPRMMHR